MKRLRLQLGAIVFAMLALNGVAQWRLGWLTTSDPLGLVVPLLIAVVMAALSQRMLSPLARDFATLRGFSTSSEGARVPAPGVTEMAALFGAVDLLRARSAELEAQELAAQRAVEDAERMRVSFVASMGHDLRGPLNAIVGFADLLALEGDPAVVDQQAQSVGIIRRSASDLLFLLDQILDWARFEAGRVQLECTRADLRELLGDVVREAQVRSADRGLRVELAIDPALPQLDIDPKRVKQALHGLMDHATRAPNGPLLELRACPAPAEGERQAGVRVSVRDAQLAIRQADHDTFFEAFRPSYAPGGKRIAGLGLGPALARVLVRAHGGDVWFESRADRGTTFTVLLPVTTD